MTMHPFPVGADDPDGTREHEARLDAELADTEALFGAELKALLDPDAGLSARTRQEVNEALLARSALSLTVDLLSVGWQTVRIMFGSNAESDGADQHRGSRDATDSTDSNDSNDSNEEVRS